MSKPLAGRRRRSVLAAGLLAGVTMGPILSAATCGAGTEGTDPTASILAFASDWKAGTPDDAGKWRETDSPNSISVVTTASIGGAWPAGMTHALRVAYDSRHFSSVSVQHAWALPAEGQYLFRRLGIRVTITGFGDEVPDHHPVQSMGVGAGTCAYAAAYQLFHRPSDYDLQISNLNTANPGGHPTYRWQLNQPLSLGTYYQIEERYQRIANDRYKVAIRVYDTNGALIFDESDFNDAWNNAGNLAAVMGASEPAFIVSGNGDHGETCLRSFNIGNQGRNYGATEYIYYGGFAARVSAKDDDWIGPYRAQDQ
jgi:hypothetical protein